MLILFIVSYFICSNGCFGKTISNYQTECKYKCIDGELQSNISYIPLANGCGSDGFRIDFSEKKFHLFNMCCNAHDLCYGTCGTNKIECDLNFKNCLESVCELLKNNSKHDCIFNGKMMYGLVTIFGCENFQESQTTACICK